MPVVRDDQGQWKLTTDDDDKHAAQRSHPSYLEALPRYLTALDPAFERAREKSEVNFLWSLFAIRGLSDAGWDPYETTVSAIDSVRRAHRSLDGEVAWHLALWIYGHAVEASEPYELLANLIDVAGGGRFNIARFPPRNGRPLSPQTKIERLEQWAQAANMPGVVTPMKEAWDRDFRNAIFHADYTLYGSEVRTMRPTRAYEHDEYLTLVNRALASHEAMTILRNRHVGSYTEPVRIAGDTEFSSPKFVVMVREGHGAIGVRDGWTDEELKRGRIPHRLGRFTRAEIKMLEADSRRVVFPAIVDQEKAD
jgi:hypothetical protein